MGGRPHVMLTTTQSGADVINLMPCPTGRRRRIGRRDLLRMAATSALGANVAGLPAMAWAGPDIGRRRNRARSCIYIFLCGGPSQLDMWDPKPAAPAEIRGPLRSIATRVPGIRIGEVLPRTAAVADKFVIVRSMHHDNASHDVGIMYTLLGTSNPPSNQAAPPDRKDHPGIGAALQYVLGASGALPAWVTLPRFFTTGSRFYKGQTGGFLGPAYDSFALDQPKKGSLGDRPLKARGLQLQSGLTPVRLRGRRELLDRIDALSGSWTGGAVHEQVEQYADKAFSLLTDGSTGKAFDLEREPSRLRDRYGRNEYGQSFLLARRLVEAGVRTVNVFWTYYGEDGCQFNLWDNHGSDKPVCGGFRKGVDMIRAPYCCPSFDRAFSALLNDLQSRGLLDETLVVVTGEFGRTPKINKFAGRDHWPSCYSAVLAGGGIQGGQVYGASDKHAAYVDSRPVTPDDFTATIYYAFGLDPEVPLHDPTGRPIPISRGNPIRDLF